MAVPMTPDQFLAALRAEGLTVVEVGSWRTHNRNHKGSWGPVHGSMLHHTGSKGEASTVELCRTGYAGLPGPLSQVVIGKSGKVYLLSAGRCNHAGGGDPNVLQAVIDERPVVIVLLNSFGKLTRTADARRIRRWMEAQNPASSSRSETTASK